MKELIRKLACGLCQALSHTGYVPTVDIPSPADIVDEKGIVYDEENNTVSIDLNELHIPFREAPKVWLTTVQDTNSMDPVVDYLHTCILIDGAIRADRNVLRDGLQVGDVIVYQMGEGKTMIIHRIIEIGKDEEGRYFRLKGDNNSLPDPHLVRDCNVKWLLCGVIY